MAKKQQAQLPVRPGMDLKFAVDVSLPDDLRYLLQLAKQGVRIHSNMIEVQASVPKHGRG